MDKPPRLSAGELARRQGFKFTTTLQREFAKARGAIMTITTDELDDLLKPYMDAGLLRTEYNRITRATEYRGPGGDLVALTSGKRHFCRRIDGPMRSVAQYIRDMGGLVEVKTSSADGTGNKEQAELYSFITGQPIITWNRPI